MKKLFLLPEENNPYGDEVLCAYEHINGDGVMHDLKTLSAEYIENQGIEVVICAGLPRHWYYTLKGMGVVTITFGERQSWYELSDIVIDCRNENPKRYFVSKEQSVCNNRDFPFEHISNLVRKLQWDSDFFGFNVAFLSCMHLTETIWYRVERFIRHENIKLVEYLCNCHDARSVRMAEKEGFLFTDIRLTFTRTLSGSHNITLPVGIHFAQATEADIPALRNIALGLYEDSRYIFDDHFDPIKIEEFYQGWVAKGVCGEYDDECWCLFDGDGPFAFCTIRFLKERAASIGLVGLKDTHWGGGYGKQLMISVFDYLYANDVHTVSVVTQGRNYAAQNLYQSVGFRTKTTQLWYHKWL